MVFAALLGFKKGKETILNAPSGLSEAEAAAQAEEREVSYLFCADLFRNSALSPICRGRSAQSGRGVISSVSRPSRVFSRARERTAGYFCRQTVGTSEDCLLYF